MIALSSLFCLSLASAYDFTYYGEHSQSPGLSSTASIGGLADTPSGLQLQENDWVLSQPVHNVT